MACVLYPKLIFGLRKIFGHLKLLIKKKPRSIIIKIYGDRIRGEKIKTVKIVKVVY
jgi:hypothetical protein